MMREWNADEFKSEYKENLVFQNKFNYKTQSMEKIAWSDNTLCFDIETSSFWVDEDGDIIPFDYELSEDFFKVAKPCSLCYIWQFSCNDTVWYGRELNQINEVLKALQQVSNCKKIIWVHNLAYEFQFLQNYIKPQNVFAREIRKPMKFEVLDGDIEFRDSLSLTRLSLDSWGKSVGVKKKTGDLNYHTLRTPLTKLTEKELGYCEFDLRVMYAGLDVYKKRYEHLFAIPLTQTGEVRLDVKKACKKEGANMFVTSCQPYTIAEYFMLKDCFSGGDTHANARWADRTLSDLESQDFTSSYPAVLCSEKFPCESFSQINVGDFKENDENYCYCIKVHCDHIKSKRSNTYLSSSRCTTLRDGSHDIFDFECDNGRVYEGSDIEFWCTDIDLQDFKECYDITGFKILECWRAKKDYLPHYIIDCILSYYVGKTELKGVAGQEDLYMFLKQKLNGIFGMCVQDLLAEHVEYYDGSWRHSTGDLEEVQQVLNDIHEKNRSFVSYSWGVFCTAYARHNLWKGILHHDEWIVYYDTDSIKLPRKKIDRVWLNNYNKEIVEKIEKCLEARGIDKEKACPKDIKGIEHPLGVWDYDGHYINYRTLGAKRYCYRSDINEGGDGKLHITVSGVKKSAAVLLNNKISNFKTGFKFDGNTMDQLGCGKQLLSYIDGTMDNMELPDGYKMNYVKFGICMRPIGYDLTISSDYEDFLATYGVE